MKIIVPVKRVIDPYVKIRVKPDGAGVETHQVKMVMNPFDEIALEEAIRLKEQGHATEVICVSIGDKNCQETLRHGLALGADRAILIENDAPLHSLSIAKVLLEVVKKESPGLVMMGKQAIDSDANQTPQMLAAKLDWPQATFASKLVFLGKKLQVVRETDAGLEELEIAMPAVVSVDLRLNEPRYATLPNIMKSKNKPLAVIPIAELDVVLTDGEIHTNDISRPPTRQKGIMVESLAELLEKIRPIIA